MSRETRGCCSCGCLISTAISAIFIWLAFRILTPKCSIEEFDLFALQNQNGGAGKHTLHYDLRLKNRNFNKGIYYDALNITFYYKPNHSSFPIGNATIEAFYQGYGKSTHRVGDIEPYKRVSLEKAAADGGDAAVFMVELVTRVRYKSPLWKTKRRSLVLGADLKVNDQGSLIKEKGKNGIKLSSASARRMIGWFDMVGILGILLFIHFV